MGIWSAEITLTEQRIRRTRIFGSRDIITCNCALVRVLQLVQNWKANWTQWIRHSYMRPMYPWPPWGSLTSWCELEENHAFRQYQSTRNITNSQFYRDHRELLPWWRRVDSRRGSHSCRLVLKRRHSDVVSCLCSPYRKISEIAHPFNRKCDEALKSHSIALWHPR